MTDRRQPKSEADLVAEQRETWQHNLAIRQKQFAELEENLLKMPDVVVRPNPELPWSHEDVKCPCGGEQFSVTRWVTISGIKYRFEAKCLTCNTVQTYDWQIKDWLKPAETA